jgi:hypothetical protein
VQRGFWVQCQQCSFFRITEDRRVAEQIQVLHHSECKGPPVPISRTKRREAQRRQARIERKLAC